MQIEKSAAVRNLDELIKVGQRLKPLKGQQATHICLALVSLAAYPLEDYFHVPLILTLSIISVLLLIAATQFFLQYRRIWRETAAEKRALQERFDVEDIALFDAPNK